MAVKIEVLSTKATVKETGSIGCAFYYVIPIDHQLVAAVDVNRIAAGFRLPAGELQDLKDGKIYEQLFTFELPYKMTKLQIAAWLENRWTEGQQAAVIEYKTKWSIVNVLGAYLDDTGWH